jgi:hypothetical protein
MQIVEVQSTQWDYKSQQGHVAVGVLQEFSVSTIERGS